MAHPGRPKGRTNKRTQQLQQQQIHQSQHLHGHAPQHQLQGHHGRVHNQGHGHGQHGQGHPQQHHTQQQHSMKEEQGVQLHDEADLISFRTDALTRFITNYEYLENVTSKMVHTSKIIPPSLYPIIPKQKQREFSKLTPEDIYFGDVEFMKSREEELTKQIQVLNSNQHSSTKYLPNESEYLYQKEKIDRLLDLQSKLYDKSSADALEKELDTILEEYKTKFNKEYKYSEPIKKYSVSRDKLGHNTNIQEAPANYNPRLINSFININNGNQNPNVHNLQQMNDPHNPMKNPVIGMNGGHSNMAGMRQNLMAQNINQVHAPQYNGSYSNQYDQPVNNYTNGHNLSPNFTMSMVNGNGNNNGNSVPPSDALMQAKNSLQQMDTIDTNSAYSISRNENDMIAAPREPLPMVNDMDDLFEDGGGLDPNLAIVNDDMGDLINFDDPEDGMMGGGAFDQDFLSQIDHSME